MTWRSSATESSAASAGCARTSCPDGTRHAVRRGIRFAVMASCPFCGDQRTRAPARVRWTVRAALVALTFLIAALGVAPRMIGMLEGVRHGFAPAVPAALLCFG